MVKAVFIDFYGTVVHEDGEVIKKVCQDIFDSGKVQNKSEIDAYWWKQLLEAVAFHGLQPAGIFTSEDAKSYKPRKELFEYALNATGLKADQVVHIGDSLSSDIKGAFSVGIKAVWINRNDKEIPKGVVAIGNLMEMFETEFFNRDAEMA